MVARSGPLRIIGYAIVTGPENCGHRPGTQRVTAKTKMIKRQRCGRTRGRALDLCAAVRAGQSQFYRAAQHGLSAQLTWPAGRDRTRRAAAARLAAELVPAARQGLINAGVAAEGQTGCSR